MINGDNVTINQSVAPTKGEQKNKKFFIIIHEEKYNNISWVEFVSEDYIKIITKLRDCNNNEYNYKVLLQDERGNIKPLMTLFGDID